MRAELVQEIKEVARRQLAEAGANLSLRAVARELGMVSSAIYRYFASRDELLTALILDAYNSLGEAAEGADVAVRKRSDYFGRWLAVAHAIRDWAVARPHEYALIYGSPVPGYAAPPDTVEPAMRPVVALGTIINEADVADKRSAEHGAPVPRGLVAELRRIRDVVAPGVSEAAIVQGLIACTELFGAISFELFGRYQNGITDLAAWYDHQARLMGRYVGLG